MAKVKNALWDLRVKWRGIGTNLGVAPGTLDAIDASERGNPGDCLGKVLATWLRGASTRERPRTWGAIAAALRAKELIEECEDTAQQIETKYSLNPKQTEEGD